MAEPWDVKFFCNWQIEPDQNFARHFEAPCGWGTGVTTEFRTPHGVPIVEDSLVVRVAGAVVDPANVTVTYASHGVFELATPPPKGVEVAASYVDAIPMFGDVGWWCLKEWRLFYDPWYFGAAYFLGHGDPDYSFIEIKGEWIKAGHTWEDAWGRLMWEWRGLPEGWSWNTENVFLTPNQAEHTSTINAWRCVKQHSFRMYTNPASALWRIPGECRWRRSGEAVVTTFDHWNSYRQGIQLEFQPMPGYEWGGGLHSFEAPHADAVATHTYLKTWPSGIPKPTQVVTLPVWTPGASSESDADYEAQGVKYSIVARLDGKLETRIKRRFPRWYRYPA